MLIASVPPLVNTCAMYAMTSQQDEGKFAKEGHKKRTGTQP